MTVCEDEVVLRRSYTLYYIQYTGREVAVELSERAVLLYVRLTAHDFTYYQWGSGTRAFEFRVSSFEFRVTTEYCSTY